MLIQKVCLQYSSCSVNKRQMNKQRAESRENDESNAGIKDIVLNRIKAGKENLHTAYRKMRISGLSNECMNTSLL